jgi:hypothetical protein
MSYQSQSECDEDELEITDNINEMTFTEVTETDLKIALKNFQNYKAPGVDQIQNFWYKKLTQSYSSRVLINQTRCHSP